MCEPRLSPGGRGGMDLGPGAKGATRREAEWLGPGEFVGHHPWVSAWMPEMEQGTRRGRSAGRQVRLESKPSGEEEGRKTWPRKVKE